MSIRIALPLATLLAAATLAWPGEAREVQATGGEALTDTDDDFLPDSVEWLALSSAANADTDGDAIGDFVEFVQRGLPRQANAALPLDHEMRIVVTGPQPGAASDATWLHVFLRRAESAATVSGFQAWLEVPFLPGAQLPFDAFALPGADCAQRDGGSEGQWLRYSAPFLGASLLQAIAQCSVRAEVVIGGRPVCSGATIIAAQGTLVTLTRFRDNGYAVQSLAAPANPVGTTSNRVCVLELQEIGVSPTGILYSVVDADCEDCNELECVLTNCAQSIGWVITVPGGSSTLGAPH
ncbi:MAG: hypothetical protein FJ301_08030 [Planctomycetes bacterium]|nr:hypothetical protein [Planctomycetota bacterium]